MIPHLQITRLCNRSPPRPSECMNHPIDGASQPPGIVLQSSKFDGAGEQSPLRIRVFGLVTIQYVENFHQAVNDNAWAVFI